MDNLYTPHLPAELVAQLKKHPITGVDQEIAVLRVILANALAHLPSNPTFNQRLRLLHAAARAASVIARLTVTAGETFDTYAEWAKLAELSLQTTTEPEPQDYSPFLPPDEHTPQFRAEMEQASASASAPSPSLLQRSVESQGEGGGSPGPATGSPGPATGEGTPLPEDQEEAAPSTQIYPPPNPPDLGEVREGVHSFHSFFPGAPP